jgi:hypothetical protein
MQFIKSLLAVGVLAAAGNVHAGMAEFKLVGTVTYGGQLAPVGTKFTGYFAYDPAMPPATVVGDIGLYSAPAPARLEATINGHTLSTQGLNITVFDNMGGNAEDMIVISGGSPSLDGQALANSNFSFNLASASGYTQVFSGVTLPTQFDLAAFNAGPTLNYGSLITDGGHVTKLSFTIDSITAVPVPAAAWLFGSGLLGLAAAARRRAV